MYQYKAVITRVVDGDTVHANVDLGFNISYDATIRLDGINAPEINTQAGQQAKDYLSYLIDAAEVELHVQERDKYGRWLATIFKGSTNINNHMIESGHAVEYHGGSKSKNLNCSHRRTP